jgi:hypothetical protein
VTPPQNAKSRLTIALRRDIVEELVHQLGTSKDDIVTVHDAIQKIAALQELKGVLDAFPGLRDAPVATRGRSLRAQVQREDSLHAIPGPHRGLRGLFTLDVEGLSADERSRLLAALRRSSSVERASFDVGVAPPKVGTKRTRAPASPPPSIGHLAPAPLGIGLAGVKGWVEGTLNGADVGFADVELSHIGWNLDHPWVAPFFEASRQWCRIPRNPFPGSIERHGMACTGIVVAPRARRGRPVSGIAPACRLKALVAMEPVEGASDGLAEIADAILEAGSALDPGDVVLIEISGVDRETGRGVPIEENVTIYYAIRHLVDELRLVVVEPAGNGFGEHPAYRVEREDADSGAIMVSGCEAAVTERPGAGGSGPRRGHLQVHSYGYGPRVDCYAWGEFVPALGLGDNPARPGNLYDDFRGTSAASAIIAGLALLVQQHARGGGHTLTSRELRDRLRHTGATPVWEQEDGESMMPDAARIFANLREDLGPARR